MMHAKIRDLLHNDTDALVALYRATFPDGKLPDSHYEKMAAMLSRSPKIAQPDSWGIAVLKVGAL